MKITLSRSQWEMIGKKAGWVKKSQVGIGINRGSECEEVNGCHNSAYYYFSGYDRYFCKEHGDRIKDSLGYRDSDRLGKVVTGIDPENPPHIQREQLNKQHWDEQVKRDRYRHTHKFTIYKSEDVEHDIGEDGEVREINRSTDYSVKKMPGMEEVDIEVIAEYDKGTRGGLYEAPELPQWDISEVCVEDTGEDITEEVNLDDINDLLNNKYRD